MNNYDVIIIGAGPGGIFGAYELIEKNPDCKIAVFEAGHELAKRKCPIDGKKIKSCISCKSCSIMSGFSGQGAFQTENIISQMILVVPKELYARAYRQGAFSAGH